MTYAHVVTVQHIRKPVPARGGNSFYRDKRDLTRFAATYCGAAVTAYDVTVASAKFTGSVAGWTLCAACQRALTP